MQKRGAILDAQSGPKLQSLILRLRKCAQCRGSSSPRIEVHAIRRGTPLKEIFSNCGRLQISVPNHSSTCCVMTCMFDNSRDVIPGNGPALIIIGTIEGCLMRNERIFALDGGVISNSRRCKMLNGGEGKFRRPHSSHTSCNNA